jgi:hypothetical protein
MLTDFDKISNQSESSRIKWPQKAGKQKKTASFVFLGRAGCF